MRSTRRHEGRSRAEAACCREAKPIAAKLVKHSERVRSSKSRHRSPKGWRAEIEAQPRGTPRHDGARPRRATSAGSEGTTRGEAEGRPERNRVSARASLRARVALPSSVPGLSGEHERAGPLVGRMTCLASGHSVAVSGQTLASIGRTRACEYRTGRGASLPSTAGFLRRTCLARSHACGQTPASRAAQCGPTPST